jgi:hypothetical protein
MPTYRQSADGSQWVPVNFSGPSIPTTDPFVPIGSGDGGGTNPNPPTAPVLVSAGTPTDSTIPNIVFTGSTDDGGTVTRYVLLNGTEVLMEGITTSPFDATGLPSGTRFALRMAAQDPLYADVFSPPSNEIVRTTSAPSGAYVTGDYTDPAKHPRLIPPDGKIAMGWSASDNNYGELDTIWGARTYYQHVYAGEAWTVQGVKNKVQTILDNGRIPVISVDGPPVHAKAGFPMVDESGAIYGTPGKSYWAAVADGYFDQSKTAAESPTGRAYPGFVDLYRAYGTLTAGRMPTATFIETPDHESEDMNEGGGSGKAVGRAAARKAGTAREFAAAWRYRRRLAWQHCPQVLFGLCMAAAVNGEYGAGEDLTDEGARTGRFPGYRYVDYLGFDRFNQSWLRGGAWETPGQTLNTANNGGNPHPTVEHWYDTYFERGGGRTLATSPAGRKPYIPIMTFELGTQAYDVINGVTTTASQWGDQLIAYLSQPSKVWKYKAILYYNNPYNRLDDDRTGTYRHPSTGEVRNYDGTREAAFRNRGRSALWA